MTLRREIESYREPKTGLVALRPHPKDRSEDNLLLFSATYLVLLERLGDGPTAEDKAWFTAMVKACEIEPGLLARYPGEKKASSWDDHVAVACAANILGLTSIAARLFHYGAQHDWVYQGNYLGRIPDFAPTLKAAAGVHLSFGSQLAFSSSVLFNAYDSPKETSGRCLLYLKQRMIHGRYPLVDLSFSVWRRQMRKLYPGGLRALHRVYFKAHHPFADFAPMDFEPPLKRAN